MIVLIFAPTIDLHALAVARELRLLGVESRIIDTADIPTNIPISFRSQERLFVDGSLVLGDDTYSATNLAGVWWRRPSPHTIDPNVTSPDVVKYSQRATRATLTGALLSLCRNFVNPIFNSGLAAIKPFQIQTARSIGLRVPDTLVTNSRREVSMFLEGGRSCVFKTVTTWPYAIRETRLLTCDDIADVEYVQLAPDTFQAYIDGPLDLRVTIVGDEVFAAAVEFKKGRSPIDGRLDRVPIKPFDLDAETREKLLLMHERLGLSYGAYDLRVDNDGHPWFLEVNPEGQYLFVEIETSLPISQALARRLSHKPDSVSPGQGPIALTAGLQAEQIV